MLNLCVIEGSIARHPELRHTKGGVPVCAFKVECQRTPAQADYIDCVAWRQDALTVSKCYNSGDMIAIAGRLASRIWKTRQGESRTSMEVYVKKLLVPGEIKSLDQLMDDMEEEPVFVELEAEEIPF